LDWATVFSLREKVDARQRVRMRVCADRRMCVRKDSLKDPLAIVRYFVVPEAKNSPAPAGKISVAGFGAATFGVLRAVGLNDESR
jgi:hypothetical protein